MAGGVWWLEGKNKHPKKKLNWGSKVND